MSDLSTLNPQLLWKHFAQICSIPHPSYHEDQLAEHIMQWARQKKWHTERDKAGNVLIRKPASPGFEQRKGVVLQAHLDMVPQKNNETQHDFVKDPIRPYVDGEWVKAKGTTLGADNGIGLASVLAVLEDDSLQHGPLEGLLTMTEETGMDGAFGLQPGWLHGELLINTDFEDEGQICVGCAGGVDVITRLTLNREVLPQGFSLLKLVITGLKGGHSGCDIHLGRGNAIKILARALFKLRRDLDLRLFDAHGGSVRNAIPREASALLAVAEHETGKLRQLVADFQALMQSELVQAEANLQVKLEDFSAPAGDVLTAVSCDSLINLLLATPNGVIRNSDVVPGVVESSLNLGVLTMQAQEAKIHCLIRSLIDSGRDAVVDNLQALGQLAGAKTQVEGGYPGWKPDAYSPLLQQAQKIYQHLFKKDSQINVIHAGLECGLFKRPYPVMDMISIGPTITGAHSPDEQVHIGSVEKYWRFLCELLKNIG